MTPIYGPYSMKQLFSALKGHSVKIECLQRLTSLSRSRSRLCQQHSEIVSFRRSNFSNVRHGEKLLEQFQVLCFVVGEQMLQIFAVVLWLVVGESSWVCRVPLSKLSVNVLLYSFIYLSTIDYGQFSFSVSDSNSRIWLSSRSVVCARLELYLS